MLRQSEIGLSTIANTQDRSFVHAVHIACIAEISDNIRCIYRRFNHCKLLKHQL